MEQDSESRFWVRYDLEGNVAALYRLSFSGSFFQRWDTIRWVDASDRYLRVTRDAACDEVSAERAQQVINEFAGRQLASDNCRIDAVDHQTSFKDDLTNPATPLKISTDSITDGFSALATSAIAVHEVFLGLVSAGFTEDQALTLVAKLILNRD